MLSSWQPTPFPLTGQAGNQKTFVFLESMLWLSVLDIVKFRSAVDYSTIMIISYIKLLTSPFLLFMQACNLIHSALEANTTASLASLSWIGSEVQYF